MAWSRLGNTQAAEPELDLGRTPVEDVFATKLELSDNKSGYLAGWLMARILLREAEQVARDQSEKAP